MSSQGPPAAAAAAQRNATVHGLRSPDTVVTIPPPLPAAELSKGKEKTPFDYSQRAQWLRAAVLGANDGLVSVSSLMLGVGAVNQAARAMVVSGLAGLVAGACSMAIGEFVSVYSQLDIELAQREREKKAFGREADDGAEKLPNPLQAAGASALAFAVGAVLPLLAGGFIGPHWVRIGVVAAVSSLALAGFGVAGALLGGSPVARSTVRVLVGGWAAMIVTFGVLRLFSLAFKTSVVG
ncbi:vacuolar iron transporter homolog 2-like [Nymphaea colorata]|uniref:Vacuolar iron transporter n=1 Tax=Nymphaea colorata TaxID=210225 RepID=A0A5K0WW38_9MAGN|nr:vacuolar iron transporter homolog 2-like [Nymphaea colorata]